MKIIEPEIYSRAIELLEQECKQYRQDPKQKNWCNVWLSIAKEISSRSPDSQTKCGAVIVKDNIPLSFGYNGFMRNLEFNFPNIRPQKYKWIIHAELNAILNAAKNGVSCNDATIYITGPPCQQCCLTIYQAGIKRIIFPLESWNSINMLNNEEYCIWLSQFHYITKNKLEIIIYEGQ
jgi:dCMP deaminase